jgi:glycerol uptake facilitator protein
MSEAEVKSRQQQDEAAAAEPSTAAGLIGEMAGMFLLILLGNGAVFLAVIFGPTTGTSLFEVAMGWAFAVAFAIYVTATLSGTHINPSVTLGLAVTGRHPWSKVPGYIGAQILGAFLASAVLTVFFGPALKALAVKEKLPYGAPGSEKLAMVHVPYSPHPRIIGTGQAAYQLVPFWRGFLVEVIATALLLIVILSLLETRSINAPSAWFFPLAVGAFVGMLVFVTAPLTMTSLNAARDLGPRIMALFMGFGKVAFPGPRNGLSLVITVVGPCVGGVLGALVFDRVLRPFYPLPERPKGPVEEPGELAEGRPGPA